MHLITKIILILIILFVFVLITNKLGDNKNETFKTDSQNWINNNSFDVSNKLEYGGTNVKGIYQSQQNQVSGPSSTEGIGKNSLSDVYDNRGFKWSMNATDPAVDVFTNMVDDQELKKNFERTYMLDPDGSVAKYDITYNNISPNCCPAQYSPPFKVSDSDASNCDFAQKYVANNYSGMNYKDGGGCVCVTPEQAKFYGTRGGNTD